MAKPKKYIVGENYGDCLLIDELPANGNSRRFLCKCSNCGAEFVTYAANIDRYYAVCHHAIDSDEAYASLPENSPCNKCREFLDDPAKCDKYADCPEWLQWFKREWRDVKSAADRERNKTCNS